MVFSLRKKASCFRNKPSKHSLIQTQFFPCPNCEVLPGLTTGFGKGWEVSRSSWRRTIRSLSGVKKEVKMDGRRGPFVQEEGDGCSWEGRSPGGGNLGGSFTGGENNETIACQVVG